MAINARVVNQSRSQNISGTQNDITKININPQRCDDATYRIRKIFFLPNDNHLQIYQLYLNLCSNSLTFVTKNIDEIAKSQLPKRRQYHKIARAFTLRIVGVSSFLSFTCTLFVCINLLGAAIFLNEPFQVTQEGRLGGKGTECILYLHLL